MKRFLLLGVIAVAVFVLTFSTRVTGNHIWFFDVGQGDASLVQWGATEWIIDGGPDTTVVAKLGAVMSLWDREIARVVLTHPDADHIVGLLDVLQRYRVGSLLTSAWVKSSAESIALAEQVVATGVPTTILNQTDRTLPLPKGWTAIFPSLPPLAQTTNDRSVVMFLTNGSIRMLWMGDASALVERHLLEHYTNFFPVDVLKIGHHGSCTSSSSEFLSAAAPTYAVISVGAENRYGHPCGKVLERLGQLPTKILRTDQWGDIHFTVNDDHLLLHPSVRIW